MLNFRIDISYDGTSYHGCQYQPNVTSIQEVLESKLKKISNCNELNIIGSGRTDSGVHAYNQVANFFLETSLSEMQIRNALNKELPDDIYIKDCKIENNDFHARFSAKKREYIYYISNTFLPMKRLYSWNLKWNVDFLVLQECSEIIVGEYDFSLFSKSSSETKNKVCKIYKSKWKIKENTLEYNILGNRFLHHMVRFLVGTMIEVSRGRYSIQNFKKMLNNKKVDSYPLCAPAKGLFLKNIYY